METTTHAVLHELLGVPVALASSDSRVLSRLRTCYAAFPACADPSGGALVHASVQPEDGDLVVRVSGRGERRERGLVPAVRALNHELLHAVMLRTPDLFFIHAATVEVDGRAVALPGPSGTGKSTLALALVQRGARLLSDELLVYDPVGDRVLPFPRALKVRDGCADHFPELARTFVGRGEGRFVPPGALRRPARPSRLGAVAVPAWAPDVPDGVGPLSAGSVFLALTASALNFGTHRTTSVAHLATLSHCTLGLEVRWRDPHVAAGRILEALRSRRT